jgi:hypothetical protein
VLEVVLAVGLHFSDPTEVEDCFVEDYMASAPQDERLKM